MAVFIVLCLSVGLTVDIVFPPSETLPAGFRNKIKIGSGSSTIFAQMRRQGAKIKSSRTSEKEDNQTRIQESSKNKTNVIKVLRKYTVG